MAVLDLLAPDDGPPTPPSIFHIESLSCPFSFEWHANTRQVYLIRPLPGTSRAGGVLIGSGVPTPDLAKVVCAAWIEGWKAGQNISEKRIET